MIIKGDLIIQKGDNTYVLQDKRKKYTIKEVIELTKGQYNNDKLQAFFKIGGA